MKAFERCVGRLTSSWRYRSLVLFSCTCKLVLKTTSLYKWTTSLKKLILTINCQSLRTIPALINVGPSSVHLSCKGTLSSYVTWPFKRKTYLCKLVLQSCLQVFEDHFSNNLKLGRHDAPSCGKNKIFTSKNLLVTFPISTNYCIDVWSLIISLYNNIPWEIFFLA